MLARHSTDSTFPTVPLPQLNRQTLGGTQRATQMEVTSILLIILAFGSHSHEHRQSDSSREASLRNRMIYYTKSGGWIVAPSRTVPDSLGGNRLLGYANLDVRVTSDGTLHGYIIRRIEVSTDTLHWITYSSVRRTSVGDSLLGMFSPWVSSFYNTMQSQNADKDSLFLVADTLFYNYIIHFGSQDSTRVNIRRKQ